MHGTSIAADEKPRPAGEGNQFCKRAANGLGRASAGDFDSFRQNFFAGAEIDQWLHSVRGQLFGDDTVALGRPLLGAPAGSGIEQYETRHFILPQAIVALLLSAVISRKLYGWSFQRLSRHDLGE